MGPQLETISMERPRILKTCSNINSVSLAEGSLDNEMKWIILENLSTLVSMELCPSDSGRPVTKSKEICDQGRLGVGRGGNSAEAV